MAAYRRGDALVTAECATCGGTGVLADENWHEVEYRDCPDCMDQRRTAGRVVSLTIPGTPAYSLSPNSRSHWRVKHRETEAAKWDVKMAIADTFCGFAPKLRGPVCLHWTVFL